jgi:hypothetical protein
MMIYESKTTQLIAENLDIPEEVCKALTDAFTSSSDYYWRLIAYAHAQVNIEILEELRNIRAAIINK